MSEPRKMETLNLYPSWYKKIEKDDNNIEAQGCTYISNANWENLSALYLRTAIVNKQGIKQEQEVADISVKGSGNN